MFENKLDSIKNNFIKYLSSLGISTKSHKNYRSDLSHFSAWVVLKVRSFGSYIETLSEAVPFLSRELAKEYKSFMLENKVSPKTVNRRLSTLRHLSRYLVDSQTIDTDFMGGIENFSYRKVRAPSFARMTDEFRSYLEAEKISGNTVKNYVSDVRQFLAWLESNKSLGSNH